MQFLLSTIADITVSEGPGQPAVVHNTQNAAPLAARYGLPLEIIEYCTAENLDVARTETDRIIREKIALARPLVLHAPYNELFPCAIDPRAAELARLRFQQTLDAARAFGIGKIVIHSGFVPQIYFRGWFLDRSAEFWRQFLAANPGAYELCIENVMEQEPELLCELAERVDDPRFRLCLDVGHANLSKIPPFKWLQTAAPWISHFHIHNNRGDHDTHQALDAGTIDMEQLLRLGDELCPTATWTLETAAIRQSLDWLQAEGLFNSSGE